MPPLHVETDTAPYHIHSRKMTVLNQMMTFMKHMKVWQKKHILSSNNSEGHITPGQKPKKKITPTCEYHNLSCSDMEDIENAGLSNVPLSHVNDNETNTDLQDKMTVLEVYVTF